MVSVPDLRAWRVLVKRPGIAGVVSPYVPYYIIAKTRTGAIKQAKLLVGYTEEQASTRQGIKLAEVIDNLE